MLVRVLGSAAGGRFPQWNCGCVNCRGVRAGKIRARERTQDSVAVSADGHAWFLLNASPDILTQIEQCPALHPRGLRHSPLAGILLSNGDLDHVLGLFSLRESHPLALYATRAVHQGLAERNAIFDTLRRHPKQVSARVLELGGELALQLPDESASGLSVRTFAVRGKLPLHLERTSHPSAEDNVCFLIRDACSTRSLLYASSVASVHGPSELFHLADCLLFDGTFWTNDELIRQGVGTASAEQMAHLPIQGETGSLALLRGLGCRRIFTHINNTNPILREDSAERAEVEARGWEVAYDGMEFCL